MRRQDDAIRGDLRVSVPPMTDQRLLTMICAFAAKHPEVRLQVQSSTELVDLQRGDHDVALRASLELQPAGLADGFPPTRVPVCRSGSAKHHSQKEKPGKRRRAA